MQGFKCFFPEQIIFSFKCFLDSFFPVLDFCLWELAFRPNIKICDDDVGDDDDELLSEVARWPTIWGRPRIFWGI